MTTARAPAPPVSEIQLTDNARIVLSNRYLKRFADGSQESEKELFSRVAAHVAGAEDEAQRDEWERVFYALMTSRRFMPNSPTLMNAGVNELSLSACFVLPVHDSTDHIFDAIKHAALIHKSGGGTGFSFDSLRPCGSYISTSGGEASGPVSFWRTFCEATHSIQQGAKRRGANMGMLRIDHPDVIRFLFAKQDLSQFTNYNVSLKVTDDWMTAVRKSPNAPFVVRWNDKSWYVPDEIADRCRRIVEDGASGKRSFRDLDTCYRLSDLLPCGSGSVDDCLTNADVFDMLVANAWKTGEPGLCFIDRIRETEPTPDVARIEATNPCGEQALGPNESCNLGSINVGAYVTPFWERFGAVDPSSLSSTDRDSLVDWSGFDRDVSCCVRFLDDLIDVNHFPIPEIEKACKANRRIGMGVMGVSDALIRVGLPYDSEIGRQFVSSLMRRFNAVALKSSQDLAAARGPFPNYSRSRWSTGELQEKYCVENLPLRNACVTTVAPTGTISIIADCSGGIEPVFSFAFVRQVLGGHVMQEVHKDFSGLSKLYGFDSPDLIDRIAKSGSVRGVDKIPAALRNVLVTARDVSARDHVLMQAAVQRHVTNSVSKTINLPGDAGEDSVREAYLLAWETRCKGITVYRDGCRAMQPMALKEKKEVFRNPVCLGEFLSALKLRHDTPFGKLHVSVSLERQPDGRFREVETFLTLGKSGDAWNGLMEACGRLSSVILRLGGRLHEIVDQLSGISMGQARSSTNGGATSIANEIAIALLEYLRRTDSLRDSDGLLMALPSMVAPDMNGTGKPVDEFMLRAAFKTANAGSCRIPCPAPGCKGEIVYAEGCHRCVVCGEGKCL